MEKSQLQRKKSNVCTRAKWPIRPGAYPVFCSIKRLGAVLLQPTPLTSEWEASPSQGYPPSLNSVAGTHLYRWVERGIVNSRARTQISRSRFERKNHEAAALPQLQGNVDKKIRLINEINSGLWWLSSKDVKLWKRGKPINKTTVKNSSR